MNILSPNLRLVAFAAVLAGSHACLSSQPVVSASLAGEYTCESENSQATGKLFLLPDMRWDVAPPFTPGSIHVELITVRTRGRQGVLPFPGKPPGIFSVVENTVRLYNTEMGEDLSGQNGPIIRRAVGRVNMAGLDRPSALAPAPPERVVVSYLVQTFRFEPRYDELVEVLPTNTSRVAVRCRRQPLFNPENRQ